LKVLVGQQNDVLFVKKYGSNNSQKSSLVGRCTVHTNRQRFWSSASVVRQSAEVDHSALLSEQFRLLVFCCRGPVDLTVFATQHWVSTCLGVSWRHTFFEILMRCTQRI